MKCEGKIGCHECLEFFEALEVRLVAQEKAEKLAMDEREKTLKLIQVYTKRE
jgi:hypothetical protein